MNNMVQVTSYSTAQQEGSITMAPTTAPPQKRKLSLGAFISGTVNTFFSVIPIISGITLLTISSAAIPVALGIAAIGLGIYHSVITVQDWIKPPAPKPSGLSAIAKVKAWLNDPNKRKSFKVKALIGSAMGAVKLGTGISLAANLGAVSSSLASSLATIAAVWSVFGGAAAVGGIIAFVAFSILTAPKCLSKINKLLDRAAAPSRTAKTPAPDTQPVSKLGNADAKTGFNASADPAAKTATNDNAASPKPHIAKPKNPAA